MKKGVELLNAETCYICVLKQEQELQGLKFQPYWQFLPENYNLITYHLAGN